MPPVHTYYGLRIMDNTYNRYTCQGMCLTLPHPSPTCGVNNSINTLSPAPHVISCITGPNKAQSLSPQILPWLPDRLDFSHGKPSLRSDSHFFPIPFPFPIPFHFHFPFPLPLPGFSLFQYPPVSPPFPSPPAPITPPIHRHLCPSRLLKSPTP